MKFHENCPPPKWRAGCAPARRCVWTKKYQVRVSCMSPLLWKAKVSFCARPDFYCWPPIGYRNFGAPFSLKRKILSVPRECRRFDHTIFEKLYRFYFKRRLICLLNLVDSASSDSPSVVSLVRILQFIDYCRVVCLWTVIELDMISELECQPGNSAALGYNIEGLYGKSGPGFVHVFYLPSVIQHMNWNTYNTGRYIKHAHGILWIV